MHALPTTIRFGFRIRTRHGLVVENLVIHGRDEADAARKLRQMYQHCQIMECTVLTTSRRTDNMSFENVVSLLTK
jgi:hypothetical protein